MSARGRSFASSTSPSRILSGLRRVAIVARRPSPDIECSNLLVRKRTFFEDKALRLRAMVSRASENNEVQKIEAACKLRDDLFAGHP